MLLLVGLYASFKLTFAWSVIDADSVDTLIVWHGIREHGIGWLTDWMFTPDSWLLTLFPVHFLLFYLFGPRPALVILSGWLILIGNAVLSGLITRQAGARRAAPFVVVALLFLGVFVQSFGAAAHPISHNSTNLLGLVVVWVVLRWSRRPRSWHLATLVAVLLCGQLSDPWMLPAYALPILLLAALRMRHPAAGIARDSALKLLLAAAISIVVSSTQIFGLLSFLPHIPFRPASWELAKTSLFYLGHDLDRLVNMVPFIGAQSLLSGPISTLAIVAFVAAGLLSMMLTKGEYPPQAANLMVIAVLSVLGTASAFVVSRIGKAELSARYLLNCVYMAAIMIGVLADARQVGPATLRRFLALAMFAAFTMTGLVQYSPFLFEQQYAIPGLFRLMRNGVDRDVAELHRLGLTYGYGPYWGSNANAVTVASDYKIRIRPITFREADGMAVFGQRWQTSSRWYTPQDAPPGTRSYFIVIKSDGEQCPDTEKCLAGVIRQFDAPARLVRWNDAIIVVWDDPLVSVDPRLINVDLGQPVDFNSRAHYVTGHGWSAPDPSGVWTDGDTASMRLRVVGYQSGDLTMSVASHAFLLGSHNRVTVAVRVNGNVVGHFEYTPERNEGVRRVDIPASAVREANGILNITFMIDAPAAPHDLIASGDHSRLGMDLTSVTVAMRQQ